MEKKTYAQRLEIKLAATDDQSARSFSGYGARFGNVDHGGDVIVPGAFKKTLADHKAAGTMPAMFFNHAKDSLPIGIWADMYEDAEGLVVSGSFLDTAAGRDAYTATKAGAVTGLSIGYFVTGYEIEKNVRRITEVKLFEISVVTFPLNDFARVSAIKSMNGEDIDALRAEIEALKVRVDLAFLSSEDDTDDGDDEEKASADDGDDQGDDPDDQGDDAKNDDEETKYLHADALTAVRNIIREMRQERHGR